MGFYCKCFNCQRLLTQSNLDNKTGYKLGPEKGVCDKCYFMFFNRVRDYLYEHPGSDMETIHKKTGVANSLITLFLSEGALESAVQELTVQKLAEAQKAKEEQELRQQKLSQLSELRKTMNNGNKVTNSKPASNGPRMRYVENNDNKRRRI